LKIGLNKNKKIREVKFLPLLKSNQNEKYLFLKNNKMEFIRKS
tara:strand:- start:366 stop:494 length:129 start_codon:yes stop_codon:yes gene_type:complete